MTPMKRRIFFGAASLALSVLAGCEGNAKTTCGRGTREVNGECESDLTCAAGTSMVDGECIPDGSVVCGTGTTLDESTGECLPDDSVCGEGTTWTAGRCELDEGSASAVTESAEPNDNASVAIAIPASGETTLGGCITPREGTADRDMFSVTATGATLLRIQMQGVHGLSPAVTIQGEDARLAADSWQRTAVDFTSDQINRNVFLPVAGTYTLTIADSRTWRNGDAVGSATTCYRGSVQWVTPGSPEALADGESLVPLTSPSFHSTTQAAGEFVSIEIDSLSTAARASVVVLEDGEYVATISSQPSGAGSRLLEEGETERNLVLVVEPEYDFSLEGAEAEVRVDRATVADVPESGTVELTQPDDADPSRLTDYSAFRLHAEPGEILHVVVDASASIFASLQSADGEMVDSSCLVDSCVGFDKWLSVDESTDYLLLFLNRDAAGGDTYTATVRASRITPSTIGATGTRTASLASDNRAWFLVDVTDMDWETFAIEASVGIAAANIGLYDPAARGVYDRDVVALYQGTDRIELLPALEGLERVLVSVEDPDWTGTETFTLRTQPKDVFDLGTVLTTSGIPATVSRSASPPGASAFMLSAVAGARLDFILSTMIDTDFDLYTVLADGSPDQRAPSGFGGSLSLSVTVGDSGVLAFVVVNNEAEAADFTLSMSVTEPPYTVDVVSEPWVDACSSGTVVLGRGFGADNALSDVVDITAFNLQSVSYDGVVVSSNGWFTFEEFYGSFGDSMPYPPTLPSFESPNAVVAPYWADLSDVVVCATHDEEMTTVQWTGQLASVFGDGEAVQFQVQLREDTLTFVYGPDHAATEAPSALGIESSGSSGLFLSRVPAAGDALRFTPR